MCTKPLDICINYQNSIIKLEMCCNGKSHLINEILMRIWVQFENYYKVFGMNIMQGAMVFPIFPIWGVNDNVWCHHSFI